MMSVVTLLFLALILFLSRHELVKAWELLHRANVWLLLLLIPLIRISMKYFAAPESFVANRYNAIRGRLSSGAPRSKKSKLGSFVACFAPVSMRNANPMFFADEINSCRIICRHDLALWMNPLPSKVTMNLFGDDQSTV